MSDIPNFNVDPKMEQLLEENPTELDEQALIDVQLYKSKKLQARRDAGESHSEPDWDPIQPGDFLEESSPTSNGNGSKETEQKTAAAGDNEDTSDIETTADTNETDDVSHESEVPSPADLEADNQIEYYQNLKEDYRIVEGGTDETPSTNGNNGDASQSTTDESAAAPTPSTAHGHDGTTEVEKTSPVNGANTSLAEPIEGLINQVDRYHEQTLELKDEIAELREENAKLREQV